MKRVGIIDNLEDLHHFVDKKYERASATEIMSATGGNTGNVAFVYAARKILGNPVTRIQWGERPEDVRQKCEHLVICCANQLGKHADLNDWANSLERYDLPVTLIGLGAQSETHDEFPQLPDGTKRFLAVVHALRSNEALNIAVRGDFTRLVVRNEGIDAVSTGCPSLHISPVKNLGAALLARQSTRPALPTVAVAAGNPWHQPSAFLEKTLVEIVDKRKGQYVLQHPKEVFHFALGERSSLNERTINRFLEIYGGVFDEQSIFEWYRRNAAYYIDAPNWMRALQRFDFVLGPRYHGVALAIQAGVPGTVITMDGRTQELCEGTAVKTISIDDAMKMSADELCDHALWKAADAQYFDENRFLKAKVLREFLVSNGLTPSEHFQKFA